MPGNNGKTPGKSGHDSGAGSAASPDRPAETDVPDEYYRIDQFPEYVKLKQGGGLAHIAGLASPHFRLPEGTTNERTPNRGREWIDFTSTNYLGASFNPAVVRAAQEAAATFGASVSGSRFLPGEKPLHGDLERAIARFLGTEEAVVCVGERAARETVIGHLLGASDLVVYGAFWHDSLVQGAIRSGVQRRPFPCRDWQSVDRYLAQHRHEYRRVLIAVEGVCSVDGDIPDLPHLIDVKRRHKTLLMVDESHSLGTMGPHGRGIGEHFQVDRRDVDIWTGTLSTALGSCGGYVAGRREWVEYWRYTASAIGFSVGISPPCAAAALAAIQLLESEPERVSRLQERSRLFVSLARSRGLETGHSRGTPVVPVILGDSLRAAQLSKALFSRGIHVRPLLAPAVEESAARLRFFVNWLHTEEQIRSTVDAIEQELRRGGVPVGALLHIPTPVAMATAWPS